MSRNDRVFAALKAAEREGRLHHAYILAGPEAPAKMECAERMAAEFSDDAQAAFARIRRGNHPDFLLLKPVEGLISVDDIRTLPKSLAYAPLEATRRIVVIEGAEGMNPQANNALLKILEEPPGHTMFFLLCREPTELLPTIVSRCQVLRFAPLSPAEMSEAVAGRAGSDESTLISFSDGSLSRAELLLRTEGAFDLRREACETLLSLWEASPRIPSVAFQWVESLTSEDGCEIALDTWSLLIRDFTFTAAGAQASDLKFPDLHSRLQGLVKEKSQVVVDEVASKSLALNRFRVYRQFNGNLRLDFASLLTDLQVISVGKARV